MISYKAIKQQLGRKIHSTKIIKKIEQGKTYLETLNPQRIVIATQENIKLSALFVPAKNPKRVIMICHGLHATKELMSDCVKALLDDTTSFLLFDFRVHGESEGELGSFGYHEKKDVTAAIEFLNSHEQTKKLPLYGIGISMGGAILMAVESESESDDFKGLIIDSAFADLEEQLKRSYQFRTNLPTFPFLNISRYLFEWIYGISITSLSPRQFLHLVDTPILFIHSQDDRVVPVTEAELLYNGKQTNKRLWVVESAKHGHICRYHPREYRQKVYDFIRAVERGDKEFLNDEKVVVQDTDPAVRPPIPSTPEYARTTPTMYNPTPPERPWEIALSDRLQENLATEQKNKERQAIEKTLGIQPSGMMHKTSVSNHPEEQFVVGETTYVPQTDVQPVYEALGVPMSEGRYLESLVEEEQEAQE